MSTRSFYVGHVAIFAYGWHKQVSTDKLKGPPGDDILRR